METNPQINFDVTRVFDFLTKVKNNIVVLRGGTRSSKSYSMSQHLIVNRLCKPLNRVYIITRKTLPALKKTAYKETIDLLNKYKVPYKLNKSDLELRVLNNLCYFMSLDDPNKAASLSSDEVWMEEAVDFTIDDFTQLWLRARQRVYLSFNPISALHWIKTDIIDSGEYDVAEDVSTYKDNIANLLPGQVQNIESLIRKDQNKYKVYNLGEWGVLENIIYGKWKIFDKVEFKDGTKFIDGKKVTDITYGLDFGFSHPSVLTEINWIEDDFIVHELLYQRGLTNAELIEKTKKLIPAEHRFREIYADHSEPARINEFYQEGFNIHKAKKDVLPGIDFCKTHLLGVTAESIKGIKELQGYSRRKDKDGHVMEEPVKFQDDFCDSFRYGSYTKANSLRPSKVLDISFR